MLWSIYSKRMDLLSSLLNHLVWASSWFFSPTSLTKFYGEPPQWSIKYSGVGWEKFVSFSPKSLFISETVRD